MHRLIYSSQATFDFAPEELVSLLETARARNAGGGVTGMLLYCSESFLQMLEGEPDAVKVIYERIAADDRHRNLRLLMDAEVSARAFPDWSMGFEHVDEDELSEQLEGYVAETEQPLINPELVANGEVAERLLVRYARNRVQS